MKSTTDQSPGVLTEAAKTSLLAKLLESLRAEPGRPDARADTIQQFAVLNGYRLRRPLTFRERTDYTAAVKLPRPLELATLAAAVGPTANPDEAIQTALRLYWRAGAFLKEHENSTLPELALAAGDYDLFLATFGAERLRNRLRLEMDKPNDEARKYLDKQGCRLRKARSVKQNLIAWCGHADRLQFLAMAKALQPGGGWDSLTAKQQIERIIGQAAAAGWNKSDQQLLEPFLEPRSDEREVYLVPQVMLDSVVRFKRYIKQSPWSIERRAKAKGRPDTPQ